MTDWKKRAADAWESAQAYVDSHFGNKGKRRPRHCIPASRDDDDLRLVDYIRDSCARILELEAALAHLQRACDAVREELT